MILLVVAVMALLGGTTWLALQQSVARDLALNRRLTGAGLALCLFALISALTAASVILIVTG